MESRRYVTMHVLVAVCWVQVITHTCIVQGTQVQHWTDITNTKKHEHIATQTCSPPCETDTERKEQSLGQTDSRTHIQQYTIHTDFKKSRKMMARRKRTIVGRFPMCPRGCTSCSDVNGCVTCERRYYIFLYRRNMRQIAMCTPSCPPGYFGIRSRHYSRCNRCQVPHCQACFARHYCTRCYPPHFAHRGVCLDVCPPGMHYANYSSECRERVDCLMGPWTSWSACTPRGRRCPTRRGVKVRSRSILENPSPNGTACPEPEDRRGCQMGHAACRDNCRRLKRHKRKRKKRRDRKWRKSRRRGRGRAKGKKKNFAERRRCKNGRGSAQRCRRRKRCRGAPG